MNIWLQKNDFLFLMDCHFSSAHIFIPMFNEGKGRIFTNKERLKNKV